MDNGYISRNVEEGYVRRIYNCFMNSAATPVQSKNREMTTVDLFPTTLAALGCTIEGDRLGLGVNLFSKLPTLAERIGYDSFCKEVEKDSEFYANHFFTKN
jgi:phosphoglycerol transferase